MFTMLMAAMGMVTLGSLGLITHTELLQPLGFPWSVLGWTIVMTAYGVVVWRAGVLPRSTALAFLLLEPGSILVGVVLSPLAPVHDHGGYTGAFAKGTALLVTAWDLRRIAPRAGQ